MMYRRGSVATTREVIRRFVLSAGTLGLAFGLVPACGSGAPVDAEMGGSAGAGGLVPQDETGGRSATADGGAESGGMGGADGQGEETLEPCDPTVDDCSDHLILYVSPLGFDGGAGTVVEPLQTVGEALERVAVRVNLGEPAPLVYACATAGDYEETLHISQEHGHVGIFGGFECESFARHPARTVLVSATPSGHRIERANGVTLGDLRLKSPDAGANGESSLALTVVESTGVRILRSRLVAGEGAPGAGGYAPKEQAAPGAKANAGRVACLPDSVPINAGGAEAETFCGGVASGSVGGIGGPGGGGWIADAGSSGAPGEPDGGVAGTAGCTAGGDGDAGGTGEAGLPSEPFGVLNEAGYFPPVGGSGTAGLVGEGGGGGGSAAKPPEPCTSGASGGSGGGGGCPGAGATGGQGGGGSFGLVSIHSDVELSDVGIVVAEGGGGGRGGDGQLGGDGANGGARGYGAGGGDDACLGGAGGDGGDGGSGGGGAGGPSIGVAYSGAPPVGEAEIALPSVESEGGEGGFLNPEGVAPAGLVQESLSF